MPYVGGASGTANSGTASVSYSATAGNLLFATVALNQGTPTTIEAVAGWTPLHAVIDGTAGSTIMRTFVKIAAGGGSDNYDFTLGVPFIWAMGVAEYSGASATLRTHAVQVVNDGSAPHEMPSGNTSIASVSGDLVISAIADNYELGAIGVPGGYTGRTLAPAGGEHFGASFGQMGAIADKVATGAVENAVWTSADNHNYVVGVYVFEAAGGGSAAPFRTSLGAQWR